MTARWSALLGALGAVWAGVLAAVAALPSVQRALTHLHFVPGPHTLYGGLDAPQSAWGVIGARAAYLRHPGGERIGLWHVLPAGPGSTDAPSEEDERQAEYFDAALARGCVVLYLHGNAFARNHGHRRDLYRLVSAGLGCHLVTLDYRGYGDSDGTPSEASQLEDAALAWAWLAERAATQRVVLWGHSLGGAVANLLCARLLGGGEPPRGLVLQATLVSMREAVLDNPLARPFAWLPGLREALDRLWADKYAAREALEVTAAHGLPVLVLHGTADAVVSFRHGLELRGVVERAQPGATGDASGLVVIEGGTHNDLENSHAPRVAREVLAWLRRLQLVP